MYMKKILTIFLLLLAALSTSFGQRRTYIERDYHRYDNVFVAENPQDGEISLYVQIWNFAESKDSVFFVLDQTDSKALQEYFYSLKGIYEKWSALAKKNRMTDFKKEIEIPAPSLKMMWKTKRIETGGWHPISSAPHYADRTAPTSAVFEVLPKGGCSIYIYYHLTSAGGESYDVRFLIPGVDSLRWLSAVTSWDNAMRKYKRQQPKKSKEDFDKLLEQ